MVLSAAVAVAGCEDGANFPLFQKKPGSDSAAQSENATTMIERDVESPDVFSATGQGLWDGRPSLGGVWVAHDDATDPERVIIRNTQNNKFVIGALFKRERSNPGPSIQVSSDAAEELGMLAGAPTDLSIVALRREEVPVEAEVDTPVLADAEAIETQSLDGDPLAAAAAAIDAAEAGEAPASSVIAPPAQVASTTASAPKPTVNLDKPFVQIGIFSVEANAARTADMMRKAGIVPTIKPGTSSGKSFWRVVVGPATTSADRSALLKKVKGMGFNDAYAVTN
ncbi:SPOR domain-containing protein [Aliiroseovarius sp. PTFE2010]|uniref:SPOR domain-containing protein n=1 Tax=Aliiroseovarius sp. PTFE2010 TaxID=3417190 RepID=UPI003CEBD973